MIGRSGSVHIVKKVDTIRKCPLLFSMDDSMAADQDISSSNSDEMINEFDESMVLSC